jgi:hypothetical protein
MISPAPSSFEDGMTDLCNSPSWPTPMSTKAPNVVTFVTRPVRCVLTLRSLIDLIPSRNKGLEKSEKYQEKHTVCIS